MSRFRLSLPESLHKSARNLAKEGSISLNQFITVALAEKISALSAETYIAERAARGSRKKFESALSKVSKRKPIKGDELRESHSEHERIIR
jgi:hypothetical protein